MFNIGARTVSAREMCVNIDAQRLREWMCFVTDCQRPFFRAHP